MKRIAGILNLTIFIVIFPSCRKDCTVEQDSRCMDEVPTNEVCLAYFKRWIYDQHSRSCSLQSYGGCSMVGFDTQEECEECRCNK